MRGIRRIISLGLSILLIGSLLTGCSKKETEVDENTLVIWANLIDSEVEEFKKIADKWSEENNIPVVIYGTNATGTNFIETVDKERPDIFFGVSGEDTGRLVKAKSVEEVPSDFLSVEEYISEDLIHSTSILGKQYGVPITQESVVLYYNKDLVEKAPKTMEDLLKDAKDKGLAFEITSYYFSYGFVSALGGYTFKNNNGEFDYNDLGVNNEGAIEGYSFLKEIANTERFLPGITDYLSADKFFTGEVAYYIGEPGRVRTFSKGNLNFEIAKLPTVKGKEVKPYKYVKMATVSSASNKKEAAWDLLGEFMKESDEIFMKSGPYGPTFKSSLESDTYKNSKFAKTLYEQSLSTVLLPNNIENLAINMNVDGNLSSLVLGEITPEECGEKIEQGIKETIKEVLTYDN